MKKEISPSEAIHELKAIQLKLRDVRDRCQAIPYWDIEKAIEKLQDVKVICAKVAGVPGY